MDSHSADSRVVGEEADVVAAVVAAPDSANDESSLHIKQVGVLFVTAGTVPMEYSGDPRCTVADEEVAAVAAAAASEQVAESIHSDLRFD